MSVRKVVYRECPWCGKKIARCFPRHLMEEHGKTVDDYMLKVSGLTEFPECENPGCHNKVGYNPLYYTWYHFCSRSCQALAKSAKGEHHYQHQNREKLPDGRDAILAKIVDSGKDAFSKHNRPRDEYGRDPVTRKSIKSRLENGTYNDVQMGSVDSPGYVYLIICDKLGKFKVGSGRPYQKGLKYRRLYGYPEDMGTLRFKILDTQTEKEARQIEIDILLKYFDDMLPLTEHKELHGWTEWLPIKVLDEVLNSYNFNDYGI